MIESAPGLVLSGSGWPPHPLPGNDKQHAADPQVGEEDVHPDVGREWVEEGEHAGVGPVGLSVQDADPQRHEGLGEVYGFLPNVGDGERSDRQIGFLCVTQGREEEVLETEGSPSLVKHPQRSETPKAQPWGSPFPRHRLGSVSPVPPAGPANTGLSELHKPCSGASGTTDSRGNTGI